MNRNELKRYLGITGYDLGQIEKDYLQNIILSGLSRDVGGEIVFKGGTALNKMGIVKRFSEDLDFTQKKVVSLHRIINSASSTVQAYNYPFEFDNAVDDERTLGIRMKIQGPLYKGRNSISTIRIEISKREAVLMECDRKEISPPYVDIIPYTLEIMNIAEIASEKVRAILTRNKARDLYDLHMILKTGARPDRSIIVQKMRYYDGVYDLDTFQMRCKLLKKKWSGEMDRLLGTTSSYDEAFEFVVNAMKTGEGD